MNGFHIQPMYKAFDWIFRYWSVSTHFIQLDIWLRALLKTVAHITRSCRRGRENDTYHVHIVFSVLCILVFTLCILCRIFWCSHCVFCVVYCTIVHCSGKEVEAVPPHPALVAGSTL